jgi:hypothetical protein
MRWQGAERSAQHGDDVSPTSNRYPINRYPIRGVHDESHHSNRPRGGVRAAGDRPDGMARRGVEPVGASRGPSVPGDRGPGVQVLRDLGNSLLAALVPLAAPAHPTPDVFCDGEQTARWQRMRPAMVATVPGPGSAQSGPCITVRSVARTGRCLTTVVGGLSLGLQGRAGLARRHAGPSDRGAAAALSGAGLPRQRAGHHQGTGRHAGRQTQAEVHAARQAQTPHLLHFRFHRACTPGGWRAGPHPRRRPESDHDRLCLHDAQPRAAPTP